VKKRGESQADAAISCGKCGESFPREGAYKRGAIAHCDGLSWAFGARLRDEAHHAAQLHPRCWACGAGLGCPRCSGVAAELLCHNVKMHSGLGAVWATKAALIEHGLVQGQKIEDYPVDWRPAYVRSASAAALGKIIGIDGLVRQVAE